MLKTGKKDAVLITPAAVEETKISTDSSELTIWPEWEDTSLANERWDGASTNVAAVKGREKEKTKMGQEQTHFVDPEGLCFLPPFFKAAKWLRPHEYLMTDRPPVVVDEAGLDYFDLATCSGAVNCDELMRFVTSQITALWQTSQAETPPPDDPSLTSTNSSSLHTSRSRTLSRKNVNTHNNNNNSNNSAAEPSKVAVVNASSNNNDTATANAINKILNNNANNSHGLTVIKEEDERTALSSIERHSRKNSLAVVDTVGHPAVNVTVTGIENNISNNNNNANNNNNNSNISTGWKPWSHIFSGPPTPSNAPQQKGAGKRSMSPSAVVANGGQRVPRYNPYGKYCIKLFWMGCWRKLTVDDLMPFDEENRLLLPCTRLNHEIWPLLLTKALLKIIALDYPTCEKESFIGDSNIIQCLTGWSPELIPLRKNPHVNKLWLLLKSSVDEFKLPDVDGHAGKEPSPVRVKTPAEEKESGETQKKEKSRGRSSKMTKEKPDKEKSKKDEKPGAPLLQPPPPNVPETNPPAPKKPEVFVMSWFQGDKRGLFTSDERDEFERINHELAAYGLTSDASHPLVIAQTRSVPLQKPPIRVPDPAWKLIRPMRENSVNDDQEEKPIRCLKLISSFVDNKTEFEKPAGDVLVMLQSAPTSNLLTVDEEPSVPGSEKSITRSPSPTKEKDGRKSKKKRESRIKPAKEEEEDERLPPIEQKKLDVTREFWIDFDVFCRLFRNVVFYHKMDTYQHNWKHSNLKQSTTATENTTGTIPPSGGPTKVDKKTALPLPPVSSTQDESLQDDDSLKYIYLDIVEPTELVVNYSCICHWKYPPPEIPENTTLLSSGSQGSGDAAVEEKGKPKVLRHMCNKLEFDGCADGQKSGFVQNTMSTVVVDADCSIESTKEPDSIRPGVLNIFKYSWREQHHCMPLLRVSTTGSRTSVLSLEPGRYVFKMEASSPLKYHIHISSSGEFQCGDEEAIFQLLTKDSFSYKSYSKQAVTRLADCFLNFGNFDKFRISSWDFFNHVMRFNSQNDKNGETKKISLRKQDLTFKKAFYETLKAHLSITTSTGGVNTHPIPTNPQSSSTPAPQTGTTPRPVSTSPLLISPELNYTLRILLFDPLTPNPLNFPYVGSTPAADTTRSTTAQSQVGERTPSVAGKKLQQKKYVNPMQASLMKTEDDPNREKVDYWRNKEISECEHAAATLLQKCWKGHFVRKIMGFRSMPQFVSRGLKQKRHFEMVKSTAERLARFLKDNDEAFGLTLFRNLFELYPDWLCSFPFCRDEIEKLVFVDFEGSCMEEEMTSWNVIFRDVFTAVKDDQFCRMKIVTSSSSSSTSANGTTPTLPWYRFRVIDNDTRREIPVLFGDSAVPRFYSKNILGYTVMAETVTGNSLVQPAGKWKLKLIGASPTGLLEKQEPKNEMRTTFDVQEIRNYYRPKKEFIFRYKIASYVDQLVTLNLTCSNPSAQIEMMIYDGEQVVHCVRGTGGAVVPAFTFQCNPPSVVTDSVGKNSATGAEKSEENLKSHSSQKVESCPPPVTNFLWNSKDHQYRLEARVLNCSWGLNRSQWQFVLSLEEEEEKKKHANKNTDDNNNNNNNNVIGETNVNNSNERKKSNTERQQSTYKHGRATSKASKQSANSTKDGKNQGSNPTLVKDELGRSMDDSMPHWVLKIVRNADCSKESFVMTKNNEEEEVVKEMIRSWHEVDPGRRSKGMQSRLKYLMSHLVKSEPTNESEVKDLPCQNSIAVDNLNGDDNHSHGDVQEDNIYTMEPPKRKEEVSEYVPKLELDIFKRKTHPEVSILDDQLIEWKVENIRGRIIEFERFRRFVEEWRMNEKEKQEKLRLCSTSDHLFSMELYGKALDEYEQKREVFRQMQMESERLKKEELALKEEEENLKTKISVSKMPKKKSGNVSKMKA